MAGAAVFSAGWWAPGLVRDLAVMRAAPETIAILPAVAWCFGAGLLVGGLYLWLERPRAAAFLMCVLCAVAWLFTLQGFVGFQDVRSSKRMVAELAPKLGPDAVWVAEGSHELGASAAIGYYLGTDADGRARTVRVMVDDTRRPQAEFGDLERTWELERPGLQKLWDGPQPVVFVTDPMRDWGDPKDAPRLPERARGPVGSYGFRRVYVNTAAVQRMAETGSLGALFAAGLDGDENPLNPSMDQRLEKPIRGIEMARAQIQGYLARHEFLRQTEWTEVRRLGSMYYVTNAEGGYAAVFCFEGKSFVRYFCPR